MLSRRPRPRTFAVALAALFATFPTVVRAQGQKLLTIDVLYDPEKGVDFGGNPPHIEYALTERGMLLLPLLESLRQLGLTLKCNECEDRLKRVGAYCEPCPYNESGAEIPSTRRPKDESIVLL